MNEVRDKDRIIKVLIFEKDDFLRQSIAGLLNERAQYKVLGAYSDVSEVKSILSLEMPDVVILSIGMPGAQGIAAIPVIKEVNSEIAILMYTSSEDEANLFASLKAGADGYILKKTSPLILFEAIDEVHQGGAPMSPSIARKVIDSFHRREKSAQSQYDLTGREVEVLKLLLEGQSIKYIAAELNIAFETARSHLRNIYKKLDVNCGKEAIAKVMADNIRL
ncbi:response regulator [Salegentibacter chungangensis]|uniref:Response regulator n=1 Tax=Salegentibacter chungangensis TaxID=1335724 RepID=A0ABW3NUQ6_9FLAO